MGCAIGWSQAFARELSIEPQEIVLGMAGDESVNVSQHLWAVYLDSQTSHATYLDNEVIWSTRDASIATIDTNGNITPVNPGTTWITAKYGNITAVARVNVTGTLRQFQFSYGGDMRKYILYIPNFVSNPAPLVIAFHGGGGDAKGMINMSQMNRTADANGFLAVYPEGTSGTIGNTWNGGNCCGYAQRLGIDDVGFVRAMVANISDQYVVNRRRIYATGMSNGSMMTHRLACEAPDLVAAVATVAGGVNTGGDFPVCSPSRAVPIIMFHGTTDENYPIEGGDGSINHGVPSEFYPVVHSTYPDTLGDWQSINSTKKYGEKIYHYKSTQCRRYTGVAPVIMCTIKPAVPVSENNVIYDGGGHSWPGGVRAPHSRSDTPSYDIDASEKMWRFFRNHML
jgi:polyhydroxybutyrate depolymerase